MRLLVVHIEWYTILTVEYLRERESVCVCVCVQGCLFEGHVAVESSCWVVDTD